MLKVLTINSLYNSCKKNRSQYPDGIRVEVQILLISHEIQKSE